MMKRGDLFPIISLDNLAKLGGIAGSLFTLASFILDHVDLLQNSRILHIGSMVTFTIGFFGTLWFAYTTDLIHWRWGSLAALYVATALYFTWVGTWLVEPKPKPFIIDNMTSINYWNTFSTERSSLSVSDVTDGVKHALRLEYSVERDTWVAIYREINPAALAGTRAIGFSYTGTGAPNTIELKLFRKPDENGKSAIFGVAWSHATNTDGWRQIEAPYSLFVCWIETGCKPGDILDPGEIWKIDIAISNKTGDLPGSGTIIIGPILGFP